MRAHIQSRLCSFAWVSVSFYIYLGHGSPERKPTLFSGTLSETYRNRLEDSKCKDLVQITNWGLLSTISHNPRAPTAFISSYLNCYRIIFCLLHFQNHCIKYLLPLQASRRQNTLRLHYRVVIRNWTRERHSSVIDSGLPYVPPSIWQYRCLCPIPSIPGCWCRQGVGEVQLVVMRGALAFLAMGLLGNTKGGAVHIGGDTYDKARSSAQAWNTCVVSVG